MTSYIDLIPREITEIILDNLNNTIDYYNVYQSKLFNDILMDKKYWFRKVKLYCDIVDLECIPHNLLDFSDKSFDIIFMNYFTIINAYNYTLHIIKAHDRNVYDRKDLIKSGDITEDDSAEYETWAYDLGLTNFGLLKLNLLESNRDMLKVLDIITKHNIVYRRSGEESTINRFVYRRSGEESTINITFSDMDEYEFKISGDASDVVYPVSRQDAINMIMHLRCNKAPEIEPF